MKAYVFYTESIKHLVTMLCDSAKGIDNLEIIPELHEETYSDCELGQTHGSGYLELCLQSHFHKLKLMKENIGHSIVFLDADIVFNNNINDFSKIIDESLVENDFLFQYDNNSGMSKRINLGIIAVKCSQRSITLWEAHCKNVSSIPPSDRVAGFPQIEFNDLIGSWDQEISYKNLPLTFGYLGKECILYHAIGTPNKVEAMSEALRIFSCK